MPRRVIASTVLSIWISLLGIEAAEQAGFFVFADQDVDKSVDMAVLGLGVALNFSGNEGASNSFLTVPLPRIVSDDATREAGRALALKTWAKNFLKEDIPIHKLHCRFLI